MGVIYILTNPAFPQYVKIGYADDMERRLITLNRSECIPFSFRVYATYEVESRLSDLKIHSIIDRLNPNLRAIETLNGKQRVREFYAMGAEDAYLILEAIAEIHGRADKLKKIPMTEEDLLQEETAKEITFEQTCDEAGEDCTEKAHRMNLAFGPDIYEKIRRNSRRNDMSYSQFIGSILMVHKAKVEEEMAVDSTSVLDYVVANSTQGRKGHKMPRMNLAFDSEVREYIRQESRKLNISHSQFIGAAIRLHKELNDTELIFI